MAARAGPLYAYAISIAAIAAVLYPLSFDRRADSFPLSSYPMFARFQPEPTVVATYMIAVGDGFRRSVPPELVGSSEVLQAQATIRGALRRGTRAMRALCDQVAARVATSEAFAPAREVRLMKGRFDAIAYLTGKDSAGRERVRMTCRVPR